MNIRIVQDFPLLIRLILRMVLFMFVLAIIVTSIELKWSYKNSMKELDASFESIRNSQLSSLAENLWQFDLRALEIQLNGIIDNPGIVALVLTDSRGQSFSAGDTTIPHHIHKKLPVVYGSLSFQSDTVGILEIHGSNEYILTAIKSQIPTIITTELAKLAGAMIIILLLFFHFFQRHLQRIITFTDSLSVLNLHSKLTLSRKPGKEDDELDRLVLAINSYGERTTESIEQIRLAEESLRASEEMYRQVFNAPDESIFIHDGTTGAILDVNSATAELYGYDRSEFSKLSVDELCSGVAPYDGANAKMFVAEAIAGGTPVFDWRAKKKNGDLFWVRVNLRRMEANGMVRVLAFVHDITEQNRLEDNLRQAQKMEAIGTLAGGVAHDFNNILSGIVGFSELALIELPEESTGQSREYIDEVLVAADRAKGLVEQILVFSRKSEREVKPLELQLLIIESLKLLRSSIPSTISFDIDLKSCSKILADSTRMHQVIMNICTNAYHAMQDTGGTLSISLSDIEINDESLFIGTDLQMGSYVRLSISDSGTGMSPETIQRIFDPYFTTKAEGRGTGLGLSMVHGIVKDHGGEISVYSEVGKGSTFHIYLPTIVDTTVNARAERKKIVQKQGTGSILFVDDEEMIRKVAIRAFKNSGYTITTCENGLEAWDLYQENPSVFDIIITDVTMPFMTGIELIHNIRTINTTIPAIVCSGFTLQMSEEIMEKELIYRFLHKPVMINTLFDSVRSALDDSATA